MVDAGDMLLWGTVGLTAGVLAGTLAPARRCLASLLLIVVGVAIGVLGGWAGAIVGATRPVAFLGATVVSVLAVLAAAALVQRRMPPRGLS